MCYFIPKGTQIPKFYIFDSYGEFLFFNPILMGFCCCCWMDCVKCFR